MNAFRYGALALSVSALLAVIVTGCGGGGDTGAKPAPSTDGGVKPSGDGGAKVEKTWLKPGTGVLKGKVTLVAGADAKALKDKAQEAMIKSIDAKGGDVPKHCLADVPDSDKAAKQEQKWIIGANNGVANVFVWLKPAENTAFEIDEKDPGVQAVKGKEVVIDQPYCAYEPHALFLFPNYKTKDGKTVETSEKLRVKSSAKFGHNTSIPEVNFNKPVDMAGSVIEGLKAKTSAEPISVVCNVHPQMQAWVSLIDNPYYAITDKDGNFEIKNVPVGKVKIYAWHEAAAKDKFITGKAGEVIELKDGANTKDFSETPES